MQFKVLLACDASHITKCPWLSPILYITTTLHIRHSLIPRLSHVQMNSCGISLLGDSRDINKHMKILMAQETGNKMNYNLRSYLGLRLSLSSRTSVGASSRSQGSQGHWNTFSNESRLLCNREMRLLFLGQWEGQLDWKLLLAECTLHHLFVCLYVLFLFLFLSFFKFFYCQFYCTLGSFFSSCCTVIIIIN